jgi:hypothetical protein
MDQHELLQSLQRRLQCKMLPTNIPGAYVPAAPREDLDLKTVSNDTLAKYGLPWHRPTAQDNTVYVKTWERACSRQWLASDRIVPHIEPQPGKTHILRKPARKARDGSFLTNAWSGAGILNGSWTFVQGTWTIPTVSQPSEPQGTIGGWDSSSWVGIDGFFVSNDVLQAGIQQSVSASGQASYVAWFEWYAPWAGEGQGAPPPFYFQNQANIANFSAVPGQTVVCFVSYVDNTWGHIVFLNQSTNQYVAIWLAPPPGANFSGNSVEWIMEAPDGGEPATALPEFTPVTFNNAMACGKTLGNPLNADTINIDDAAGTVLTSVAVGNETLTITFIG